MPAFQNLQYTSKTYKTRNLHVQIPVFVFTAISFLVTGSEKMGPAVARTAIPAPPQTKSRQIQNN